jgi:hypothetical protein
MYQSPFCRSVELSLIPGYADAESRKHFGLAVCMSGWLIRIVVAYDAPDGLDGTGQFVPQSSIAELAGRHSFHVTQFLSAILRIWHSVVVFPGQKPTL